MNMSGASGINAVDRISADANMSPSLASGSGASPTQVPTTMSDLKKAELRGEKYTISDEQVVKALERAIKSMQGAATSLEFSVHEKTKTISVKVMNADTGEVIREIPPEKTLDFVAKLWEMAGLFVDVKR